jgi:hypothetical protein
VYSTISNVATLNFQKICNYFLDAVGVIYQEEKILKTPRKGFRRKGKAKRGESAYLLQAKSKE